MKRIQFTLRCLTLVFVLSAPVWAESKRNIVFILIDDQRYDAMGIVNPFFETPHIDSLAQGGILFENAFVTTSLCSPSRASILSGQWAHRHGVLDNSSPLTPESATFPRELQKAGYKTGFIGKWHMGGRSDEPRPGFDHWVSFRGQGVYYNQAFNVNGTRERRKGYTTDLITEYAEEFISNSASDPFMLYVSHKAVHANFEPAERHRDAYANRQYPFPDSMADTDENYAGKPDWVRKQRNTWHGVDGLYNNSIDLEEFALRYAETLKGVDDSVGRIVGKLREEGLLESTLIVFTSDNGFQFGEHGLIDKRTMYEESMRVPLIAHCPDLFDGGQRRTQMIANTDFFPTFMDVADIATPSSVQGESFYSVLTDTDAPGRESLLYTYFWERAFPQTPTVIGVRTDRYKLMTFHGTFGRYELYDLQEDPREMNNLIADFYTTTQAGNVEQRVGAANTSMYAHAFESSEEAIALRDLFKDMNNRLTAELERLGGLRNPNWHTAGTDAP